MPKKKIQNLLDLEIKKWTCTTFVKFDEMLFTATQTDGFWL